MFDGSATLTQTLQIQSSLSLTQSYKFLFPVLYPISLKLCIDLHCQQWKFHILPTHTCSSLRQLSFFFLSNHWNRWQCWDARRMPRNSFCSRHLALQKYRHIFHRPGPDHWSCAIFILGMICMVKSHGHNSSRHFIQHISIRRTRAASDGSCRSYLRRLSPTTIHCWLCAFQHFHRICSCFCFFSILDDLVWF